MLKSTLALLIENVRAAKADYIQTRIALADYLLEHDEALLEAEAAQNDSVAPANLKEAPKEADDKERWYPLAPGTWRKLTQNDKNPTVYRTSSVRVQPPLTYKTWGDLQAEMFKVGDQVIELHSTPIDLDNGNLVPTEVSDEIVKHFREQAGAEFARQIDEKIVDIVNTRDAWEEIRREMERRGFVPLY